MADPHGERNDAGQKEHFHLKIISPSPEIGPLQFPTISTSCTIKELKEKISDASATKVPLPPQQRLIYRGHVLAQEQRTLKEVFGQDTIDQSSVPLIIHLVLNPGAHLNSGSTSTSQPQSQHASQSEPLRPNSASNAPTTPSSTALHNGLDTPPQGQAPAEQHFQAQVPQPNPFPQMQHALAIMNQQMAAQMAALGGPTPHGLQNAAPAQFHGQPSPLQQHPHIPQPPQVPNQPPLIHHNLQPPHPQHQPHTHFGHPQTPTHPSPTRLGHQLPGSPHMTPLQAQQHFAQQSALRHQHRLGAAAPNQGADTTTVPRPNSAPPPGLGNTNTVIRETYGPNGERHQSIVSSGTFQLNRGIPVHNPGLRHRGTRRPGQTTPGTSAPGTPTVNVDAPSERGNPLEQGPPNSSQSHLRIQLIQSHMLSMELAMNLGTVPPESVQEQIRTLLLTVAPTINQQQYQYLDMRRSILFDRASAMRRNQDAQMHWVAEQIASQRTGQPSQDSSVYLLSSPSGPHALLISPSGTYTAPWPAPVEPQAPPMGLPNPPIIPLNELLRAQQAQVNAVQLAQAHPDRNQQIAHGMQLFPNPQQVQPHPLPHGQPAEQNDRAPNPARDIVRILIPLGGHLWLLIRLFGFVYFFTHGASWQRTIFLSLVATLLFIAQTGLFQPLLQTFWGPIRRHAEALLPLAGNEPPRGDNAPPAENNGDADGVQRRNQEPTPQQAAERLLREREAQDGNFMRQSLRRVERAVALFVASLVPGVGERHIAAREAAEAARLQQEREREETARREEEERVKRAEEERGATQNAESANSTAVDESRRRLEEIEGRADNIVEPT